MNSSTAKQRKRLVDKIGREFAKASDQAWLAGRSESYSDYAKRVRALERDSLRKLKSYPRLALETQRRTSEMLFVESVVRGLPLATCRRKLSALDKLGYHDALRRAHYRLIFVRGAIARGQDKIALRMLGEIHPSIRRSMNSKQRKRLGKELLNVTESLIVQLLVDDDN